jgi:putative flippase GtrA
MAKHSKKQSAKQKNNRREVKRITEYLVSGGAYFWSGYIAFFVFYRSLHWTLFPAKILADVVGWVINYILQRYWVFNNAALKKHKTEVTGRYIVITLVDFIVDYIIVDALKDAGLTPYLGQFVSAGFFTIWNYFWYRFWVFPDKYTKRKRTA